MIRREVFHNDNFVTDHSTMTEDNKSILEQCKTVRDKSQSVSDNARIGESEEAQKKARRAFIKLRERRRKRTIIIKMIDSSDPKNE